ncbi:hypothetical protein AMAG_07041 [Allomyces macrogynus ATCC 38327]|uniref:Uncharacterized protein n=1 Tax=Allomyces macrogynus (strain ATCC 38327) TaxID=578462 RepID=A0A0L0SFM5_ALLM3|nr:hypothetical protein AMAG_07041 [Allomyces macrogynus ATCC 38327]|eukprot:KNE61301.1 hypothetical protein AMAG_07041 [Allomyces macrogynus ATCC 38327]
MRRTAKLFDDPRDAAAPLHLWAKSQGDKASEIALQLLPDELKHLPTVEFETKMTFPLPEATTNWLMQVSFQVDKLLAADSDTLGVSVLFSALSQCHRPATLLRAYYHARHGKSLKKHAELLDDSRVPLPAAVLRKIAAHSMSMDNYSAIMQSLTAYLVLRALDLDCDTEEEAVQRLFDPAKLTGMTPRNWMTTTRAITRILEHAQATAPTSGKGTKGATGDRFLDALPQRVKEAREICKWTDEQTARAIAAWRDGDVKERRGTEMRSNLRRGRGARKGRE